MAVSSFDKRYEPENPVAVEKQTITIDVSADNQNAETDVILNGTPQVIYVTIPSLDSGATLEFKLIDADDTELYASGEKAAGQTVELTGIGAYLCQTITLRVEASAAQSGDKDIVVKIYYT